MLAEIGSLADFPGATFIMMLFMLLVAGFMLMRTYRRLGTRPRFEAPVLKSPRRAEPRYAGVAGAEDQIRRAAVEMLELARDAKAEIDTKLVALAQMTREAERQESRLAMAVQRAQHIAEAGIAPDENIRSTEAAEISQQDVENPDAVDHDAAIQNAAVQDDVDQNDGESQNDDRYGKIYAMADTGASAEAIARDVGSPIGEVDLILSLRSRG